MDPEKSIGIFDSGIGGLTVASRISELLPNEKLIYFGDTNHVPYGNKSLNKIQFFSKKIVEFLIKKKCKAIVIACNSASAAAYESVKKITPKEILLFNVIDPVINYIKYNNRIKKIGIIGTHATISSNIYKHKIGILNKSIKVHSLATPLLANLIEENDSQLDKNSILHSYLRNDKLKNIDSLILGCTHYPLIQQKIELFYENKIEIINSIDHIAMEIEKKMKENKLLNNNKNNTSHEFYVSDYTKNFQKQTNLFFPSSIILQEQNIFS